MKTTYSGQWQEPETITEVRVGEGRENGWVQINCGSMGFGFEAGRHGVMPMVGDTVELNTVGFSNIRGVKLNGKVIFLKSDQDADREHQEWCDAETKKKQEDLDRNGPARDAQIATLPPEFQRRMARLREKNPDFRREYEPYDLMVCLDAVKIARAVGTPEGVVAFQKKDWKEQKAAVPDLDEGHSGNSFGAACQLAHLYLSKPALVPFMHGALAALVGCEGYGCHPLTPEEEAEIRSA